jgi:thiamine-phosphate pyrophosphorylase
VLFLVAGDGRLAAALGADGLHLAEGLYATIAGWRRRRPGWLITAAAHSVPALRRAGGADAALLSPAFPTASHPGRPHLGPLRFAALTRQSPLPVVALGGVNARTAARLAGIPLAGFAAISGLVAEREKPKT